MSTTRRASRAVITITAAAVAGAFGAALYVGLQPVQPAARPSTTLVQQAGSDSTVAPTAKPVDHKAAAKVKTTPKARVRSTTHSSSTVKVNAVQADPQPTDSPTTDPRPDPGPTGYPQQMPPYPTPTNPAH